MLNSNLSLNENFNLLKQSHDKLLECVGILLEDVKDKEERIKLNLKILKNTGEMSEMLFDLIKSYGNRLDLLEKQADLIKENE